MSKLPKPKAGAPLPAVGTVFAAPVRDGWAACQVIRHGERGAFVATLDWFGRERPTLEQLSPPRALVLDHHAWKRAVVAHHVGDSGPPDDWISLGELRPAPVQDQASFAGWTTLLDQVRLQWRWDHETPEETRALYAECRRSERQVTVAGASLSCGVTTLSIGPGELCEKRSAERVAWSELEALGCLSHVIYTGADQGVLAFVRRMPLVRQLRWRNNEQTRIDVTGLGLDELVVSQAGPLEIHVDQIRILAIEGTGVGLTVNAPDGGAHLQLQLSGARGTPALPLAGLAELRDLRLHGFELVSMTAVALHEHLTSVVVTSTPTVRVTDLGALAAMRRLAHLELRNAYDLEVTSLGALPPSLRHVSIDGYRKEHEKSLRA